FHGKEPAEFGLDETNLVPVSLETFEILGKKQYGAFNEDEQFRYYFMTDADYLWGDTVHFSVFAAISYMLICLVITLIMLGASRISRQEFIEDSERLKEKLKQKPGLTVDPEVLDTFREADRGGRSVREWWHDLTPEQKVGQMIRLSITIILISLLIILNDKGEFGSRSVFGFILHGSWKRGVNELSVTAILISLVSLLVFILFKDLLCRILSSMFHAKGKTIIGLFSSLLQYIAIITTIFFCLSYLGFDTSVLITSASILTLAISLGSKDLIADILAGVFIIFEGDFHVGDIVEVNGFKGKVIDIGVRSTKLKNSSNNIKIIDNQSVKNVLNMSKESSWIFVSLKVSSKQPLKEIEEMLDRELPKVGEHVPMILNGPFYFGIDEIGYHWLKITIGAACYQSDINKLKPQLNQHLWEMFKENGFEL
ncbi:MAG: mechanosensitive ion channel, partial [Anaerolineaceae bacterium]|nr:mechanosensitive ion channel [Anaerolineaceae bacterium]